MTAFARVEHQTDWGNLAWEIRSVNHRYLDLTFKIPESLRRLEPALREACRKHLHRGKVDCLLRIDPLAQSADDIHLNLPLVKQVGAALSVIHGELDTVQAPSSLELLKWPGVIVQKETEETAIHGAVVSQFQQALTTMTEMRVTEGEALRNIILEKLSQVANITANARSEVPAIIASQNERIRQKLTELQVEVDENRLEQELVHLAQKADVVEELDRLAAHVDEVGSTFSQKGGIGRRLDFLMQELNREANTLSSKAIHADTTIQAVELKVLIEQMREQVQNIE